MKIFKPQLLYGLPNLAEIIKNVSITVPLLSVIVCFSVNTDLYSPNSVAKIYIHVKMYITLKS